MPKRVYNFVKQARVHETWWLEFYFGLMAFAIGVLGLVRPLGSIENAVDIAMLTHPTGHLWFLVGSVYGAVQILALATNKPLRWINAFVMCAWWTAPVTIIERLEISSVIALVMCCGAVMANLTAIWCLVPHDPTFARRMLNKAG